MIRVRFIDRVVVVIVVRHDPGGRRKLGREAVGVGGILRMFVQTTAIHFAARAGRLLTPFVEAHRLMYLRWQNLKVWVHDGIPFFYINILLLNLN